MLPDGDEPYTLSMPGFPVARLEGCLVSVTRACRRAQNSPLSKEATTTWPMGFQTIKPLPTCAS